MMNNEEFLKLKEKLEKNGLYKKSGSVHKAYQFMLFKDNDGNPLNGQKVRREDVNLNPEGSRDYDESTSRIVIYNFVNGVLESVDDEPAVQYAGHWEYWKNGLIEKVYADGGDTEEYWKEGVPYRIETDLATRRKNRKDDV